MPRKPKPTPEPPPPPPPPPPVRTVQPGEDIAAAVAADKIVILAPGAHRSFVLTGLTGVDITFSVGAAISGATRAVEIIGGQGILRYPVVYDNGCGLQFRGACDWIVEGGLVSSNDRMIRNDTNPNNDYGAMGVAFDDVTGSVVVRGVEVCHNRVNASTPSIDYGLNEGSAFELFKATGITIEDCVIYDNQIVVETGTNDLAKPCGLIFRRNTCWNGKTDTSRLSKGILWRSGTGLIEHNVFDGMDHWAVSPTGGGGFSSPIALTMRDNVTWTPAASMQVGAFSGTNVHDYNAVAGSLAWGSGGAEAHGKAEADPFIDRANHDYRLKLSSTLIGAAHDGTDIGL